MENNNTTTTATTTSGHHTHKKHGFTGRIGFVMAAAGSAVGVLISDPPGAGMAPRRNRLRCRVSLILGDFEDF